MVRTPFPNIREIMKVGNLANTNLEMLVCLENPNNCPVLFSGWFILVATNGLQIEDF